MDNFTKYDNVTEGKLEEDRTEMDENPMIDTVSMGVNNPAPYPEMDTHNNGPVSRSETLIESLKKMNEAPINVTITGCSALNVRRGKSIDEKVLSVVIGGDKLSAKSFEYDDADMDDYISVTTKSKVCGFALRKYLSKV